MDAGSEATGEGTNAAPNDDLVARDASTLTEVLAKFDGDGFRGQFRVHPPDQVECLTCRTITPAREMATAHICRLEGASDPADMLMVVALICPACDTRGTLILNYGPESTLEDSGVIDALVDQRTPASPS